ncbi:MAG: flagellar basal body P-ring formation chaperone FlgA [Hyphomicrobiaceae bacterium]
MGTASRLGIFGLAVLVAASPVTAGDRATYSFPVPSVTINAGDKLTDELVVERDLVANSVALRTYFTAKDQVVGKVAKRVIRAGAAIPINALREDYVFKEGERVMLEFTSGGLSIFGAGLAIQPGVIGEPVRVRNIDTGVVVTGVVKPNGRVAVEGG